MKPTAFAHFERTLGAESRVRTDRDIEAGIVEAPKPKKKPQGKMGRPRRSPEEPKAGRDGKVTVEFPCSPKFTAAAALQATMEGTTTKEVMERWMTTLAFADEPKNPAPREVMFTLHMAVGEDAFPEDVFRDLCAFADEIGVSPNRLATAIVKEALAKERLKKTEGADANQFG